MNKPKRFLGVIATTLAALGLLVLSACVSQGSVASENKSYEIAGESIAGVLTGSITCNFDNNEVVGLWIETDSHQGEGWATLSKNQDGSTTYSRELARPEVSYTLHIGCGGTSAKWASDATVRVDRGTNWHWVCSPRDNAPWAKVACGIK